MNRIERMLWEEENIKAVAKQKSRAMTCAKIVSIALLVAVFALVASRPWPPSFADARVQTAAAKTAAAQSAGASNPGSRARVPPAAAAGDSVAAPRVVRH